MSRISRLLSVARNVLQSLGLFVLLTFFIWVAFLVVSSTWVYLNALPTEIITNLTTVTGAVVVATITVVAGRFFEKQKDIETKLREKKLLAYEPFMKFWLTRLLPDKSSKDVRTQGKAQQPDKASDENNNDILAALRTFTADAVLWGSVDVVERFLEFRRLTFLEDTAKDKSFRVLYAFDDVLFAIRRDLGNSTSGLKPGDLIKMIITDPDNLPPYDSVKTITRHTNTDKPVP